MLLSAVVLPATACDSFLDVNDNPNAPEVVNPNLLLAPMVHWIAVSEQFDGRFVGRYTQQWTLPPTTVGGTPSTWDRMGYDPGSDNAAQLYRDVYWNFGNNLTDMIKLAEAEERWDLAGVGHLLRGWGWLKLTNLHGELIVSQAFTPDKFNFDFDTQEYAYEETFRLLDKAIEYLQRTDGNISPTYLAVGDKLFNGDVSRWLKFAYGLQAMALNQFSNKSTYDPAAGIPLRLTAKGHRVGDVTLGLGTPCRSIQS
jgi:hypothetical protein